MIISPEGSFIIDQYIKNRILASLETYNQPCIFFKYEISPRMRRSCLRKGGGRGSLSREQWEGPETKQNGIRLPLGALRV